MPMELVKAETLDGTIFFTPGEVMDFFNRVKRSADLLNADIVRTSCFPAKELKAWSRWYKDFQTIYVEYGGWWPRLWSSSWDVAERWQEEVNNWRIRYKAICPEDPSGADPAKPTLSTMGFLEQVGNTALIIAVPVVAYYGFKIIREVGTMVTARGKTKEIKEVRKEAAEKIKNIIKKRVKK